MIVSGELTDADYVWSQGFENWVPLGNVKDRFRPTAAGMEPDASAAAPGVGAGGVNVDFDLGQSVADKYKIPRGGLGATRGAAASFSDYAGFWLRFVAFIIDSIVLAVLGCIGGGIAGAVLGGLGGEEGVQAAGVAGQVVGIVINALYYSLMESSSMQATLGKRALGLRVTDLNGERISFARALGRWAGKIISGLTLGIGYIMAGFTSKKQALHDMIAGCLVVRG
jgi:uncharacterized RDD family membrane protein YckC